MSVSAHPEMNLWIMGTSVSFQFRNEQFFARSRKSRDCAEAYIRYVAQAITQIDAEIAKKGHFWMETS
jgi:proline dehydrogenase